MVFNLTYGLDYDLEPLEGGAGQKEKRNPTLSGDQHKTIRKRGLVFNSLTDSIMTSSGWREELDRKKSGTRRLAAFGMDRLSFDKGNTKSGVKFNFIVLYWKKSNGPEHWTSALFFAVSVFLLCASEFFVKRRLAMLNHQILR
ncbi:hypothetical protein [Heyndrickxia acidicola]|uniref:Uncharacterized protein n=1 Tax=Heyndrickxia acidicola TaxID=209389 RepID=A0ABU6MEI8_9BACI|nr:hypothetical protein [Heyndrickxia acidicola]MED1202848.1 hypothetical protein [Heyndrickxia acidicola]